MSLSIKIDDEVLEELREKKNLLAFSGGIDSSALFFLLREEGIDFDISLVNYQTRKESLLEEEYAKSLAKKHNILAHTIKAPKFKNNFEKRARDFRYSFFESLIKKYRYNNLITAHQLNDQLEWFLMRLTKGAGFIELLGFSTITKRENFNIIRPLLNISKDELLNYLNKNGYKYFIDKSNSDIKYERNYFRAKFSNSLIDEYRDGIKRSFEYMQKDKEVFLKGYKEIFNYQKFYIIKLLNRDLKIRVIDIYLKKLGYLLSSAQREEIEKSNSIVIGGIWAIEIVDNLIYISLYIKTKMPKKFKEKCRVLKIPSKSRGYIYIKDIIEKLA